VRTPLRTIPGIGRTFTEDFARIGVGAVEDLAGRDPGELYATLSHANQALGHRTSKNYLYVIRMAVYFANGGREASLLRWSAWKDGP
jgi:hypothetical protein